MEIYRTIIMPAVLYGCETWSMMLREEHRLRIIDNRALTKILVSNREDGTEELHKHTTHQVIKSQMMRGTGHEHILGKRHMHTAVG
jgi:hypothetical protein